MKQIKRKDVKLGQTFYSGPDADKGHKTHPCIALNNDISKRFKKQYWGGADHLWHLYVNSGDVTWMGRDEGEKLVWIE